jgi:hypothetical protein
VVQNSHLNLFRLATSLIFPARDLRFIVGLCANTFCTDGHHGTLHQVIPGMYHCGLSYRHLHLGLTTITELCVVLRYNLVQSGVIFAQFYTTLSQIIGVLKTIVKSLSAIWKKQLVSIL